MLINIDFITGFMIGIEFHTADEETNNAVVLDLGIIRIVFEQAYV